MVGPAVRKTAAFGRCSREAGPLIPTSPTIQGRVRQLAERAGSNPAGEAAAQRVDSLLGHHVHRYLLWRGRPASVPGARLLSEWPPEKGLRVRVPSSPPFKARCANRQSGLAQTQLVESSTLSLATITRRVPPAVGNRF